MKLAEALSQRAALTDKVRQLKVRLDNCVKIQEGDTPVETPADVLDELDKTLESLRHLIYCINITNTRTEVDGRNITSMLAERDTLKLRVATLADSLKHLTEREDRYNRNEIRFVRTVDAGEFRRLYDTCASQLRRLDLKIQSLGWMTDLIEEE